MAERMSLRREWGDRPADAVVVRRGGRSMRVSECRARIGAWRDTLAARPGRRWALAFRDGYEFACALLGGWEAGKCVVLATELSSGSLERLRGEGVGFVGEFPLADPLGAPDPAPPPSSPVEPDPEAPAVEIFTSGSTGDPVAIPKTLRQLDREVETLQGLWGEEVGTALVVASVSHQHFYGLIFKLLWPLRRGAPFLAESLGYPEEVVALLARESGVWVASPALLKRLPPDLPWDAVRPNLRFVQSAGSALPPEAARQCAGLFGRPVTEVYGSTETGVVGWRREEPEGPWRPFPGVAVRTLAEDGLLAVRSPWLPDEAEWPTADRGEVGPAGTFRLSGRADRIVKVEEKRISLTALERALTGSGLAAEARTLLLPDGRMGAAVVLAEAGGRLLRDAGRRAVTEALCEAVRPTVEAVAIPRRFRFLAALPQDAMGKVADAALRRLFLPAEARPQMPRILEERQEGDAALLRLHVAADLAGFAGHFPEVPILPGVVQVEWAVEFARRRFTLPRRFLGIEQLKFQRVIVPESTLTLTLSRAVDGQSITFRYVSDAGAHSSGRIRFGE